MTKILSALVAAATGLGVAALATPAYAAPTATPVTTPSVKSATPRAATPKATPTPAAAPIKTTPSPTTTPKASVSPSVKTSATPSRPSAGARAFTSDLAGDEGWLSKTVLDGTAGEQFRISGNIVSQSNNPDDKVNAVLHFNPAPADFLRCEATSAANGGVLGTGTITWNALPATLDATRSQYVITCTLTRSITSSDVATDTLKVTNTGAAQAPQGYYTYRINGSATPTPTPVPTPTPAPTPAPTSGGQYQPGDWWVGFGEPRIDPATLYPRAGATYVISGKLDILAYQATTGFALTFNPAPGGGAVRCVATGSNGAVAAPGKLSWSGLQVAERASVDYTITCTYQRDHQAPINERVMLTAPGHVFKDDVPLVDSASFDYTVGGQLPSQTGGNPAPVADKASTGGLAKTGA